MEGERETRREFDCSISRSITTRRDSNRSASPEEDQRKREKEEEAEFAKLQALYEKQQQTVFKQVGAQQKQLQQLKEEGKLQEKQQAQLLQQQRQQQQQPALPPEFNTAPASLYVPAVAPATSSSAAAAAAPAVAVEHTPGQIFVCTNKWCREKGADATMATFSFLAGSIPVVPVNCLGRCNKGPNIRIFTPDSAFIEASMVRSVETVVSLLQEHLHLKVNITSADVLRLNYEGNVFLREGEVDYAIDRYNRALALGDKEQEGVLLVMRGSALLQRAYACRLRYRDMLSYAEQVLPSLESIKATLEAISSCNKLPASVRGKMVFDYLTRLGASSKRDLSLSQQSQQVGASSQAVGEASSSVGNSNSNNINIKDGTVVPGFDEIIRKCNFSYSLYEFALMGALEDLLTATILLPGFAQAWRRAGDALGELQHFNSAIEYFEIASKLDAGLSEQLVGSIERFKVMDKIVANAESKGWTKEVIAALLADVA